jgi:hypothetical protein
LVTVEWLVGWSVMLGGKRIVKVATALVVDPNALVAMIAYSPASLFVTLLTIRFVLVAPEWRASFVSTVPF